MEESCVARVVSPGRFTSIGDEEAQVNVRRNKARRKPFDVFRAAARRPPLRCIYIVTSHHTQHRFIIIRFPIMYISHDGIWMGSPHLLFGLLCPPPSDGHTAALFFLDIHIRRWWYSGMQPPIFSCVFVISFFFFVFQLLFRYICSLPCLLSLSLSFFWLIDHKDDHRQQRSDRSVAVGPLHYYFRKRRAAL